jgi:hypothetical protein
VTSVGALRALRRRRRAGVTEKQRVPSKARGDAQESRRSDPRTNQQNTDGTTSRDVNPHHQQQGRHRHGRPDDRERQAATPAGDGVRTGGVALCPAPLLPLCSFVLGQTPASASIPKSKQAARLKIPFPGQATACD